MYNSILTPNDIFENNLRFKEVPYYNVEQRQREEQAKREREKKEFLGVSKLFEIRRSDRRHLFD